MHQITQIYNRVMSLESSQNFVSTQYLENEWMEFDKILHTMYIVIHKILVGIFCIILRKFITTELWPLTRVNFVSTQLRSLIHVSIVFLLIIVRINEWNSVINMGILTRFNTSLDFVNICHTRETFSLIQLIAPGGGICVTLTHFCVTLTHF